MKTPLSEKVRPSVEAAPWVVAAIRRLEEENEALRLQLADAVKAMVEAHSSMFEQCLSNPVYNAWGKEVNVGKINFLPLKASGIEAFLSGEREKKDDRISHRT